MSVAGFTAFLVDDDAGVLKALTRLVRTAGYDAKPFSSSQDFLAAHDPSVPGCAILDVAMPGLDGLQLQDRLLDDGIARPIIFLTGNGDIPMSVRAMKAGAVDFLTKPIKRDQLLFAIERAAKLDEASRRERNDRELVDAKLSRLTPREREVLLHVVAGRLNKQIAADLGTVEKTIKVHRGRVMAKLEVRTVADLVRMAERAGLQRSL